VVQDTAGNVSTNLVSFEVTPGSGSSWKNGKTHKRQEQPDRLLVAARVEKIRETG